MKREIRESIPFMDFEKMYKVFEEPPYNEKWTVEELTDEYKELSTLGHVCGYYIDNMCIGLMTFRKMILGQHPVYYEHSKRVVYLADLVVLSEYRGQGIGSELMRYALETSKREGYDIAYMRTLPKGQSMSYGLAVRLGLTQIENVFQAVSQERNVADRAEIDNRIFLDVNLHNWS